MDKIIKNEYAELTADGTFRLTAERLVLNCGIHVNLKGSECLEDAVILYGTGACTAFCEIYRIVGLLRGIKAKTVMREISYAISHSDDLPTKLSALAGFNVTKNDIHNALVIACLGKVFRTPALSLYSATV